MDLTMWLVVGVGGLALLVALAGRDAVSTPAELAATAARIAGATRESWEREPRALTDLLCVDARYGPAVGVLRWREGFARPRVGRLEWWSTEGISDGLETVTLALRVDGQVVEVTEYPREVDGLRPGMLLPVVDLGEGFRLALGYPAGELLALLADHRREAGLLDDVAHAAWLRGRRSVVAVADVCPTGRVRDDHVEVAVLVGSERVVGFVRPEEAGAIRLSRQVPVCVLDGRVALGWFPF